MALPSFLAGHLTPLGGLAPLGPVGAAPAGGAGPAPTGAKVLSFSMQTQSQTQWCWAAVSASVAQYFSASTTWANQCDVANTTLGRTDCCGTGAGGPCNIPYYLDTALTTVGHYSNVISGATNYDGAVAQIDQDRPLGVRIGWSGGGGHFVVVCGYDHDPAIPTEEVEVADPYYGSSTLDYNAFKTAYKSTGTWTHSYYTTP